MDDTRGPSHPTAHEDAATESAVLHHLLALHPIQITIEELIREVTGRPDDFPLRDSIERAVRDLAAVGLLHQRDTFVLPTHAALRFHELINT